jgi:hypothetical protein
MLGGMGVILAVALIVLGIESKQKIVDKGRVTDAGEARVFDLWAFFHYLVPALIGTGVTAIAMAADKGLSGSALLIIGTSGTLTAAVGWELLERHLGHTGWGESPSNIVGDVVIGTLGGATASTGFLFALGKKIPAGVVYLVGVGFASVGLFLTSALIWYGWIEPKSPLRHTWPGH